MEPVNMDEKIEKRHDPEPGPVDGLVELGSSGLKQTNGYIFEDFLDQLRGPRGVRTYTEMRFNSATIGAVLYAIESMILQVDWPIVTATENPTPEQIAARDFVEGALFKDMEHTWPEMLSEILSMMTYGWAFLEVVFKRRNGDDALVRSRFDDGRIGWRKFGIRSQDTLDRWEFAENGNVLGMWQNNFYATAPGKAYAFIPLEKALLFTFRSWRGSPEGRSALRNAYRSWFFSKRLQEVEAIGIERDMVGLPVMEVPQNMLTQGAGAAQKTALASIYKTMKNIRNNSQAAAVVPAEMDNQGKPTGFKFKLLTSGGKRTIDPSQAIQRYEKEIAMTLLAQFLFLGMDKAGSFSLAESSTDLFAVSLGATMDRITEKMNREAIPQLMRLNGVPQENWPIMTHGDVESRDITVLADYVSKLISAGAISADGLEEKLREVGGLPPREGGEAAATTQDEDTAAPTSDTEPAEGEPVEDAEVIEQQAPDGPLFKTGLGGAKPHTHTFRAGDKRTSVDNDHDHALTPGAADTAPGGPDGHTHTVPRFAQGTRSHA